MSLAVAPLPSDPDDLRAFAARLQAEIAARDTELYAKTLHIEKLKAQLAVMRRARFGRSSEKLDRMIEQLELLIGDLEESQAEADARSDAATTEAEKPASTQRARRPLGRKPLPDHLPREVIVHEAACSCPNCGGTSFGKIGDDEREVLECVPSHFKCVVHVRPKLSCRACENIVQAPMPSLPIERGRPGPTLLAHVLSRNIAITYHCIARVISMPVPALNSTVRPLPDGLAPWLRFLIRWWRRSVGMSAPVQHCMLTTRRFLFWILDAARRRPGVCGHWYAMNGHGGRRNRQLLSIAIRQIARANMPKHCSQAVVASCMRMPCMPANGALSCICGVTFAVKLHKRAEQNRIFSRRDAVVALERRFCLARHICPAGC
jgi:hypothetical protein